jgi:hypothetical protein
MTLNICLTTRNAVYLSGDFRLTYTQGQKRWFEDNFDSQKLIPIVKYGWCGLVAFCGVAKLPNGRQVGDWIAEQVRAEDMGSALRLDLLRQRPVARRRSLIVVRPR